MLPQKKPTGYETKKHADKRKSLVLQGFSGGSSVNAKDEPGLCFGEGVFGCGVRVDKINDFKKCMSLAEVKS